jgi:hypothetical protein
LKTQKNKKKQYGELTSNGEKRKLPIKAEKEKAAEFS